MEIGNWKVWISVNSYFVGIIYNHDINKKIHKPTSENCFLLLFASIPAMQIYDAMEKTPLQRTCLCINICSGDKGVSFLVYRSSKIVSLNRVSVSGPTFLLMAVIGAFQDFWIIYVRRNLPVSLWVISEPLG